MACLDWAPIRHQVGEQDSRDSCARARRPKALVYTLHREPPAQASRVAIPPKALFVMVHGDIHPWTQQLPHVQSIGKPGSAICRTAAVTTLQSSLPRQPSPVTFPHCPRLPCPLLSAVQPAWQPRGSFYAAKSGHVCLLLRASLMPHRFRTKSEIPMCSQAPLWRPRSSDAPAS